MSDPKVPFRRTGEPEARPEARAEAPKAPKSKNGLAFLIALLIFLTGVSAFAAFHFHGLYEEQAALVEQYESQAGDGSAELKALQDELQMVNEQLREAQEKLSAYEAAEAAEPVDVPEADVPDASDAGRPAAG